MGWTGRAPAPNGSQSWFGAFEEHEERITMTCKRVIAAVHAIGIDTGKNTLHMVGLDQEGAIVLREKVARGRSTTRLVNVPPSLIRIEAGIASHYVARKLLALGHDEVPPAYAKPFPSRTQERLSRCACDRGSCPALFDPLHSGKDRKQLGLQALYRVRSRLIGDRTAMINQLRGFLLEHGIPVRQGVRFLRQQLPQMLASRSDVLSLRMVRIMEELIADWEYLDGRIEREKRSRRRIRDLVALPASQSLEANENRCARISMMARSTKTLHSRAGYRSARPSARSNPQPNWRRITPTIRGPGRGQ
jgi:transposase